MQNIVSIAPANESHTVHTIALVVVFDASLSTALTAATTGILELLELSGSPTNWLGEYCSMNTAGEAGSHVCRC